MSFSLSSVECPFVHWMKILCLICVYNSGQCLNVSYSKYLGDFFCSEIMSHIRVTTDRLSM